MSAWLKRPRTLLGRCVVRQGRVSERSCSEFVTGSKLSCVDSQALTKKRQRKYPTKSCLRSYTLSLSTLVSSSITIACRQHDFFLTPPYNIEAPILSCFCKRSVQVQISSVYFATTFREAVSNLGPHGGWEASSARRILTL